MSQMFVVHPDNPQARLLRQAVTIIQQGGLIVYPTDSGYALGCQVCEKKAIDRMRTLRQLHKNHLLTLICRDLSALGVYAQVSKPIFRMLKALTPGAYTFILNATREIPRLMMHPKRKTVGLRVPDHAITLALLDHLDAPLISTSLVLPGANVPLIEPAAIHDVLGNRVDLVIDAGECHQQPTTVVDLTGELATIIRQGKGDSRPFLDK